MMVNKSGPAAAISSASGVNGLSSCSRMGAYSKGALNTVKLLWALIEGDPYSGALNQAIAVISFLGPYFCNIQAPTPF